MRFCARGGVGGLTVVVVVAAVVVSACGSAGGTLQAPERPGPAATDPASSDPDAADTAVPDVTGSGSEAGQVPPGVDTTEVTLLVGGETARTLVVYVADTPEEQQRGLMEVTDLAGRDGMLFIFAQERDGPFHMRNTPTPLTIAFFDADGRVVSILDMEPCEDQDGCPNYHAEAPYRYALEIFQGRADELGLTESAVLQVRDLI